MTENRAYIPAVSNKIWWQLRKRFKQSLPAKVDEGYLVSVLDAKVGSAKIYKSRLHQMGLLDENFGTTSLVNKWRDDDAYKEACEEILENCVPTDLVSSFPPPEPDLEAVKRWFTFNGGLSESSARQSTAFYALLCEADPSKEALSSTSRSSKGQSTAKSKTESVKQNNSQSQRKTGGIQNNVGNKASQNSSARLSLEPNLQLNVEIHISPETSVEQIEAIFENMAKHLNIAKHDG